MEINITNKNNDVVGKALVSKEDFEGVKLHDFVKGDPPENIVWDNISAVSQNKQKKQGTLSKFIGVCWNKRKGKWKATCGKQHLGSFDNELAAGKAYDKAAISKYGEKAKTNNLLSANEISNAVSSQIETSSFVSKYGKGVYANGNKFKVVISQNNKNQYFGTYDTLEEAQKVAKQAYDKQQQLQLEQLNNTPIQRNEQGEAVIPVKTKDNLIYSIVDDETWHDLMKYSFRLNDVYKGYVIAEINGTTITMHQYLYRKYKGDVPDGFVIDHIGKNETDPVKKKLNNKLENLRVVSQSQNNQNRCKSKKASSLFIGVYRHKLANKWCAMISYNKKNIYLGIYADEEDAAIAYNKKAVELYGESAKLNILDKIASNSL
jgi:hypothetical protein